MKDAIKVSFSNNKYSSAYCYEFLFSFIVHTKIHGIIYFKWMHCGVYESYLKFYWLYSIYLLNLFIQIIDNLKQVETYKACPGHFSFTAALLKMQLGSLVCILSTANSVLHRARKWSMCETILLLFMFSIYWLHKMFAKFWCKGKIENVIWPL